MLRKTLIIFSVCTSLWFILCSNAIARCTITAGALTCRSICTDEFMKGVVDNELKSTAGCVSILVEEMQASCLNPADNSATAEGISFYPNVVLSDAGLATAVLADESGKVTFSQCWGLYPGDCVGEDNCVPYDSVKDPSVIGSVNGVYTILKNIGYLDPSSKKYVCPNKNWVLIEGSLFIKKAFVFYGAYQCLDGAYGLQDDLFTRYEAVIDTVQGSTNCGYSYLPTVIYSDRATCIASEGKKCNSLAEYCEGKDRALDALWDLNPYLCQTK